MSTTGVRPDVEVRETIDAPPQDVYDLVTDVPRMGEWSPETASCRWLDSASGAAVGARFRGSNRRGPLAWTTTCTVTAAEPGKRFAFSVAWGGLAISDWAYTFEPTGSGCTVVESWSDRRPGAMRLASMPVMGVVDRSAHNRRGMVVTLAALKRAAESG